ncbi:MAG: hypothetical protein CSA76_00540 [Spirochaetales bacterium]|nr:MAG: hypothetical protein CSA76_00540 [Spirochaetales bacterium]
MIFLFPVFWVMAETDTPETSDASVYVIPLREDVDRYLGVFLGRSLEAAREAGAQTVILEIDTFGGRVDTALEIASKIGAASAWARTVAYVPADTGGRGVSWSAGALMAFSASELWMAPGTSMGAAAPVYQTAEGMQAAGEKTVSAVRGQMAALAEKNGYPVGVALAMVDADVVLQEITLDGKTSLATMVDIDAFEKAGLKPRIGRTVSGEGKLLTLTAGEMERYGVSSGTVSTRGELLSALGYTEEDVAVLEKSTSDSFLTVLTSGAVTSLLLVIAMVALYLEITSPGFGVPGTIALICFAVVFGASGMMGNLGAAEILMFLIGTVLLLLEIFVIPGFGVAGISGILLILGALVFSMQNFYWPKFDWQWTIARRSFTVAGIGLLGGIAGVAVLMTVLQRASVFDRLILFNSDHQEQNGRMKARGKQGKIMNGTSGKGVSPGDTGIAVTDLRPVGKVKINGRTLVAETEGEYYDKGTAVLVQMADGVKIIVVAEGDK